MVPSFPCKSTTLKDSVLLAKQGEQAVICMYTRTDIVRDSSDCIGGSSKLYNTASS